MSLGFLADADVHSSLLVGVVQVSVDKPQSPASAPVQAQSPPTSAVVGAPHKAVLRPSCTPPLPPSAVVVQSTALMCLQNLLPFLPVDSWSGPLALQQVWETLLQTVMEKGALPHWAAASSTTTCTSHSEPPLCRWPGGEC